MNKFQFLKFYGKYKQMTNKVSNGDMSNGTTGWQHYSNFSTESIVSGELKSLRDANRPYVGTISTWAIPTGRKIYVAFKAYANRSGTSHVELFGTFGSNNAATFDVSLTTSAQRFSRVVTTSTYTATGVAFDVQLTSSGDYIMLDNVLVIDLTAEFGAGNEPSAATMDAALANLPNSWFDGTQNIPWAA